MNNPIEVNITTLLVNIQWRRDVYFLDGRRQQHFFLRIDALRELEDAILTISGRFELYEKIMPTRTPAIGIYHPLESIS